MISKNIAIQDFLRNLPVLSKLQIQTMILNFLHTIKAPIVQQLILWNYQCKIISLNYLFKQVIEIPLKNNKGTIQIPRLAPGPLGVLQ